LKIQTLPVDLVTKSSTHGWERRGEKYPTGILRRQAFVSPFFPSSKARLEHNKGKLVGQKLPHYFSRGFAIQILADV